MDFSMFLPRFSHDFNVDVLGPFPLLILQEFGETIQIQGTKVRDMMGRSWDNQLGKR